MKDNDEADISEDDWWPLSLPTRRVPRITPVQLPPIPTPSADNRELVAQLRKALAECERRREVEWLRLESERRLWRLAGGVVLAVFVLALAIVVVG